MKKGLLSRDLRANSFRAVFAVVFAFCAAGILADDEKGVYLGAGADYSLSDTTGTRLGVIVSSDVIFTNNFSVGGRIILANPASDPIEAALFLRLFLPSFNAVPAAAYLQGNIGSSTTFIDGKRDSISEFGAALGTRIGLPLNLFADVYGRTEYPVLAGAGAMAGLFFPFKNGAEGGVSPVAPVKPAATPLVEPAPASPTPEPPEQTDTIRTTVDPVPPAPFSPERPVTTVTTTPPAESVVPAPASPATPYTPSVTQPVVPPPTVSADALEKTPAPTSAATETDKKLSQSAVTPAAPVVVTLPAGTKRQVLFPAYRADFSGLTPDVIANNNRAIDEIAQALKNDPNLSLLVEGYANPVLGTSDEETETLMPLSNERAINVANMFVQRGIPRNRIKARALGGTKLITTDESQWYLNRRVEITLTR